MFIKYSPGMKQNVSKLFLFNSCFNKIIRKIWNFDMIEAERVHYKKFIIKIGILLKAQVYKWTNFQ